MTTSQSPFLLIDGSSYLYRAFHALPPLTNSQGQPTGAIYGVLNMLRRLLDTYQPTYLAVVFDAKGKTFRDDLYPAYKAHRKAMPDDLIAQVAPLHEAVRAMGLPLLCIEGVEADDVIGTLARQAKMLNWHTIISTGDKDMAQLVDDHITLVNTMSNTVLDSIGVQAKFGVAPTQIIDYLALMGDSSDNIPGVPSVGPKTAAKWLQQYQTLDNLITHAAEISGKVGEQLRAHLAHLTIARELVTIQQHVPLLCTPEQLQRQPANVTELDKLFAQFEFKTWLAELSVNTPAAAISLQAQIASSYDVILTEAQFIDWLARLQQAELFSFDTETTSLDTQEAQLVGISFAIEPGQAAYVPVGHDYLGAPAQLSRDWVLEKLKPLLDSDHKKIIGHNLKYDRNILANYHINLRAIAHDTMLESYVLNSTASRHDMDTLAKNYLNYQTIKFEDIAGKGKKQITFNQVALEQAAPYAAEDADITLRLHHYLWPKLSADTKLVELYNNLELLLLNVLADMEYAGVLLDTELLKRQSQELAIRLYQLEQEVYAFAGVQFNLSSPKQLQTILYEKLQLPVLQKTATGQAATGEEVLQQLAEQFELPKLILEHRGLSKLKSTYTDRLPEQVSLHTGRVHTSYHQAAVATGRLSSSDPNLQNIPVRTAEGRRIRQAFIAKSGYQLIAADYSQIELRIMAHLSQDPGLLKAFANNMDIHRATAAEVFGVSLDQVTADQRRSAKAINFGLIYGMSAFGLAKQIGVDRNSAQQYIDIYFTRYPGVRHYMDSTRKLAHQQGYVETLFGRRLYLKDINARQKNLQNASERAAINAPLQGTAADIIKRAMINVHAWLQQDQYPARLIMQVHDELVFEVANESISEVTTKVRDHMMQAAALAVPLLVEIGVGQNWDEAH